MISPEIICYQQKRCDQVQLRAFVNFVRNEHPQIKDLIGFNLTYEGFLDHTVRDPDFEPGLLYYAIVKGKIVGISLAIRRIWKKGENQGWLKFLYILQDFRGRGIGTELYRTLETKIKDLGVEKLTLLSSSPHYFMPGIPLDWKSGIEFLLRKDWIKISKRTNLLVYLKNISEEILEKKIEEKLRNLTRPYSILSHNVIFERKKIKKFIAANFSPSWAQEVESILKDAQPKNTQQDVNEIKILHYLIQKNTKEICGFIAIGGTNPNWLGPMGVKKSHRRKGLGSILLQSALLEAKKKGQNRLLIPWVNTKNINFYENTLGSTQHRQFWKMTKDLS